MMNIKRILSFSELEPNWNGAGSSPISDDVIGNAISVYDSLKAYNPFISPTGRNSIQFEWGEFSTAYTEVEVNSNVIGIYCEFGGNKFETDINIDNIEVAKFEMMDFLTTIV